MESTVDVQKLQQAIDDTLSNFQTHTDANRLIIDLRMLLFSSIEDLIVSAIEKLLSDPYFFEARKKAGGKTRISFQGA